MRGCDTWSCHAFTVDYLFTPDPEGGPGWIDGIARLTSHFQRPGTAQWEGWSERALFYMFVELPVWVPFDRVPELYFSVGGDPDYYIAPDALWFQESGPPAAGSRTHFVDVSTTYTYGLADAVVYVTYSDGTSSTIH